MRELGDGRTQHTRTDPQPPQRAGAPIGLNARPALDEGVSFPHTPELWRTKRKRRPGAFFVYDRILYRGAVLLSASSGSCNGPCGPPTLPRARRILDERGLANGIWEGGVCPVGCAREGGLAHYISQNAASSGLRLWPAPILGKAHLSTYDCSARLCVSEIWSRRVLENWCVSPAESEVGEKWRRVIGPTRQPFGCLARGIATPVMSEKLARENPGARLDTPGPIEAYRQHIIYD